MPDEIRAVLGNRGSCKTLFVVWIMAQTVEQDGDVCSNIASFTLPQLFAPFTQIVEVIAAGQGQAVFGGKIIVLDELGKGADSYEFLKKQPRKISELIFEIRKYRSIMYYTAQRLQTVTKRIREQTDVFYLMDAITVDPLWARQNPDEVNHMLDGRYVLRGRAHVRMTEGPPFYRVLRSFEFDGRAFYHLYDSWEVVGAGEGFADEKA